MNIYKWASDDLISFSLDFTAALIALFVFKIANLHRNILDDRRLISASPFNLSRGLARPFADLIKKIVRGNTPARGTLRSLDQVFDEYIRKERLQDERIFPQNVTKDKLFILFPKCEEEVCSIKRLREIERNRDDDGRKERFSISVNPIIQDHRCERSGNYFPIKIEVMKIRRNGNSGNLYVFVFENRPLRTLYAMEDDSRIKFERPDLEYHFHLFYDSLKDMLKEDKKVNQVVKLIQFEYIGRSLRFTEDLLTGISQSFEEEGG